MNTLNPAIETTLTHAALVIGLASLALLFAVTLFA